MPCPENDQVQGEVTGFTKSPEGELAFAKTEHYGSVSILINASCWQGSGAPIKGEVVMIVGLTRFPKGWRAVAARKFTLADETRN